MISGEARHASRLAHILLFGLAIASALPGQSLDRRLYQEAGNRFRSRDYDVALAMYLDLIDSYPLSRFVPDAQFRRAVSLFRLGQTDDSLDIFRLVESTYPTTDFLPFVPFWIGVISYNDRDYLQATSNLRRYIAGAESSLAAQARLILAVSENELGNPDAAITMLESLGPDGFAEIGQAVPFLASLYVRSKQYRKVVDLVRDYDSSGLSVEDQQRLDLYEAEGFWHLGDQEKAAGIYETLRNTIPDISSVAYQRLFAYYQNVDETALQSVVLDAEIELAGKPSVLAEFWLRIGIETYGESRFDLARSYFQRVWNLRRSIRVDGLVPLYLAELHVLDERPLDALQILETFISTSESQRELILFRLGGIYLDTENWPLAVDRFAMLLEEFPESRYFSEASYLSAYSLYRNERPVQALGRIDLTLSTAGGGAYTDRLLRLQSVLFKQVDDLVAAVETLREYIPLRPEDAPARMDLVKLLFTLKKFDEVVREAESLRDVPPFDEESSPFFLLTNYMYGLSLIDSLQYEAAIDVLELITFDAVVSAGLELILPYTLFYRGWAYYRTANFLTAEMNFADVVNEAPGHELYSRAAYLAGWSAFVSGDFVHAEEYLLVAESSPDLDLRIKSVFMRAKSLAGQEKFEEAAILFENIYLGYSTAPLADDALFEYAGSLWVLDKIDESVETYRKLSGVFPLSPLAEESMYKRGEILFAAGRYEAAREAFYEHRIQFPRGSLYDAALYWGGMASFGSGEPFGAVLLWEILIEDHEKSAFRADSLLRTAEVYEASGDFRKSLNYFSELIALFPEEAEAISADLRAEKLRYLILGQGEREAELSVIIDSDGVGSIDGRLAILELARIYIFKSGSKQNLAPALLEELIDVRDVDPATAAQAQYLFGEYYYRKNDLQRAANEFLKTITIFADDRDLSAQSMYRAAEMAHLAGSRADAETLVRRIESNFPSSQWVEEGRKLLTREQ